ncbi:cytochrome P450 [Streptomyces sp. NPDC050504]|uniref:cytochrome P450 n=1 Tax=Streptomyces sp. NPDC050504 TaxID=3365618 RepID=UPI0037B586E0
MPHEPSAQPVAMPTERRAGCPFDPAHELATIQERQPLARLSFPDGHTGWLATGHSAVRALLADPRISVRYELLHYPYPDGPEFPLPPAPVGDMLGLDAPQHTRFRRKLMGKFTVRRMRQLSERVAEITEEHLDALERSGPGTDLVEAYARPIPALMICELLGVPYADRDAFQGNVTTMFTSDAPMEARTAAMQGIDEFIRGLVREKRSAPADDLLSDLTQDPDLSEDELTGLGGLLLAAGLDTTANMIAHGAFALLSHPKQAELLRTEPDLADRAVEELMRYLTVAGTTIRSALADIEIDGQVIRAGETVVLSLDAANRDPAKFADPDSLDLRRETAGQLGFGHGAHQCLGQQLARVELKIAMPALFTRFPTLRLAVAPEAVRLRTNMNIYGVVNLPVAWDEE